MYSQSTEKVSLRPFDILGDYIFVSISWQEPKHIYKENFYRKILPKEAVSILIPLKDSELFATISIISLSVLKKGSFVTRTSRKSTWF